MDGDGDAGSPASAARWRERARWLAASGRADASAQQRVLRDLLDAGSACHPADVVDALVQQVGPPDGAVVRRLGARLRALSGSLVLAGEPAYPSRLRDAWPELGAPLWLFVVGALGPVDRQPAVAVVGTRSPTADGLATARALATALARAGVTVVSGMARGIDQVAHRGALDGSGRTVAVLGTGLGVDYPARSGRLRAAVAGAGALVTELVPGVGPRPWQFLARNRIISGLTDATVVVEGRERSGALQTARLAAAQGRDVWAVPGSLNAPTSAGPLALLRDGALPVTSIDDLVAAVADAGPAPPTGRAAPPATGPALSADAAAIAALLGAVAASSDELAVASRLPVHAVLAAVGELVDAGVAATTPGGVVRAAPG